MKKWKLMPGNPGKAKHIEEELGVPALVSEVLDDEVMAMFEGILTGRKNIVEMRAEIEALKAPKAVEPAPAEVAADKKFCPSCGKELDSNAKFCLNCGAQQP